MDHARRARDLPIAGALVDVDRGSQIRMGFQIDAAVAERPRPRFNKADHLIAQAAALDRVRQVELLHLAAIAPELSDSNAAYHGSVFQQHIIFPSRPPVERGKVIQRFIEVGRPGDVQLVVLQVDPNQLRHRRVIRGLNRLKLRIILFCRLLRLPQSRLNQRDVAQVLFSAQRLFHCKQTGERNDRDALHGNHPVIDPVLEDLQIVFEPEPPLSVSRALTGAALRLQRIGKLCGAAEVNIMGPFPQPVEQHRAARDDPIFRGIIGQRPQTGKNL